MRTLELEQNLKMSDILCAFKSQGICPKECPVLGEVLKESEAYQPDILRLVREVEMQCPSGLQPELPYGLIEFAPLRGSLNI